MSWQCKLYGHQWRHPGTYEVVVARGTAPVYPFQCATCGSEMQMDLGSAGPRVESGVDSASLQTELESESDVGSSPTGPEPSSLDE